ncbi:Lrp/AsnC family transcriptional regulator [Archaeoglobus veneficus]|uniref:Transcriptional regulator, AsnC family n=1 Tax=Archaeoglobus veneficus (strain DSM 11195 / SNP6) TaxID=693661 RepID=F2KNF8_ARCVS|nr:Lrp/AsnC family transcriptional regulator [Archaeoglobus veneficus]AEA47360.1 transcriptional regulator, AsnC family [Archaeoglobus veneficus SNP6]
MDDKDRQIISMLQNNGRLPLSRIADIIGFSVMGVKKRVEKLESKGLMHVRAMLNVEKLGINLAIIAMEMENAEAIENVVEKFKECPRVLRFFVTTGAYNLFAIVIAEDYHTLESMSLERCSLRNQKGIRRFEIYPVQDVFYSSFFDIGVIPKKTREDAPCGVFCGECTRYRAERCVGCPTTVYYRGVL